MRGFVMLLAAVCVPASATAANEPDTILVEVRVGPGQVEQQRAVEAFVEGWGAGIVTGSKLVRLVDSQVSRSAGPSGGLLARVTAALEQVQRQQLARRGNWRAMVNLLKPIRDELPDYTRVVATDPETRHAAFQAMVLLALAYHGSSRSDEEAELVGEIVRSFRDKPITEEVTRGPEFYNVLTTAKKVDEKQRTATLLVEERPNGCTIFVDEVKIGTSPKADVHVAPGRHYVFVDCGTKQSRVVDANVAGDTIVRVDVEFDGAIETAGDHVALVFASEQARHARANAYAARLGRALHARRVVTVGAEIDARLGVPALVGRIISSSNEVQVASHSIAVPAGAVASPATARELAARLRLKEPPAAAGPGAVTLDDYPADPLPPGAQPWWKMNQLDAADYDWRRKDYRSAIDRAIKAGTRTDDPRAWRFAIRIACQERDKATALRVWPHVADRDDRIVAKGECEQVADLPLEGADAQLWGIRQAFIASHYAEAEQQARAFASAHSNDVEGWEWLGMAACANKDAKLASEARARTARLEDRYMNATRNIDRVCKRANVRPAGESR